MSWHLFCCCHLPVTTLKANGRHYGQSFHGLCLSMIGLHIAPGAVREYCRSTRMQPSCSAPCHCHCSVQTALLQFNGHLVSTTAFVPLFLCICLHRTLSRVGVNLSCAVQYVQHIHALSASALMGCSELCWLTQDGVKADHILNGTAGQLILWSAAIDECQTAIYSAFVCSRSRMMARNGRSVSRSMVRSILICLAGFAKLLLAVVSRKLLLAVVSCL